MADTDPLFIIALTQGISKDRNCPVFEKDPKKYFLYLHTKYRMPYEIIARLTMKSCRFFSMSFFYEEEYPIGLISIESTDPGFLKDEKQTEQIVRTFQYYDPEIINLIEQGVVEEGLLQKRLLPLLKQQQN